MHDGKILPLDSSGLKLIHQRLVCRKSARHDQQARRILVDSVHQACPRQGRQLGVMMEQSVLQGTLPVTHSRVHHQARRLVDNDHGFILEHDVQRQVFSQAGRHDFRLGIQFHQFPALDPVSGTQNPSVNQHPASSYPALQTASRVIGENFRQRLIEAKTGQMLWNPGGNYASQAHIQYPSKPFRFHYNHFHVVNNSPYSTIRPRKHFPSVGTQNLSIGLTHHSCTSRFW